MFDLIKMLFPKLYCAFADPTEGGGAPDDGQPAPDDSGNGEPTDKEPSPSPTDFVEFEGAKVPKEAFEKQAKELFKDQFDAYENREKWQKANTERAMELKQIERDAEAFRRLQAEHYDRKPSNPADAVRQEFVNEMKREFPDIDERYWNKSFEWQMKLADMRANAAIQPDRARQAEEWERNFLKDHPLIQPGSDGYQKMVERLQKGYDPEEAYRIVYEKELSEQEFKNRQKTADDERLKKLKGSPTGSQEGDKTLHGSRSEKIWQAMEKAGFSRG